MCLIRLTVLIFMVVLINAGVSESLQPYHELVRDNDLLACGGFLMRRKRIGEIQVKKRILSERLEQRRLDHWPLGSIFTTGLPQEDVGRYYFSKKSKNHLLTFCETM